MHELSIAQSLLETTLEAIKDHPRCRVKTVHLQIGELRQVVASSLIGAFELLADQTPAQGADLKIEWVPTVWRCPACGKTQPAEQAATDCPCGSPAAQSRLEGHDDLLLTSLDLDT